jgi:hypothetical protein
VAKISVHENPEIWNEEERKLEVGNAH